MEKTSDKLVLALYHTTTNNEALGASLKDVNCLTILGNHQLLVQKVALKPQSFDEIVYRGDSLEELNKKTLMSLGSLIKAGSAFKVESKGEQTEEFKKNLRLSGFVDFQEVSKNVYTCNKKVWKKTKRTSKPTTEAKKENPFKKVKKDLGETKKVKIDDDSLLKNDKVDTGAELGGGCETKPRACNNCSCGRKELEDEMDAEELKKNLEKGNIKSKCGNCYLGDAFRCASCPYKGKPAFLPGDKIKLDLGADSNQSAVKTSETKVVNGAVKLDL